MSVPGNRLRLLLLISALALLPRGYVAANQPLTYDDSAMSYRPILTMPLLGLALIGIGLNSAAELRRVDVAMEEGIAEGFAEELALYRQTFPEPEAVYLDQYSLMVFFAYHDRWRWRPVELSRYELSSAETRIVALRDRRRWNVDVLDERFYRDVAGRLRSAGIQSTTLFSLRHSVLFGPYPSSGHDAVGRRVRDLAARYQLKTRRLVIHDFALFAEFSLDPGAARGLSVTAKAFPERPVHEEAVPAYFEREK